MHSTYHTRKVLIELELEVFDDFDLNDVDFHDLLDMEPGETVEAKVTELSEIEL